jgi:outer membrane protein, heavy metal efflux system
VSRVAPVFVALVALAGCMRYTPVPLEPSNHAAAYRARSLRDTSLIAWVARWAGRPDGDRWTDRQLAVAALALRSELARARAEWRATVIGERIAGARPAPGAAAGVERAVAGSEGASPWVVSLGATLAVELGGKRGARVQQARAESALAEAELRGGAWRIAVDTRAAALALASADAARDDAVREADILGEIATLERARYEEAALTAAELARTASDVQLARGEVAAAEAEAIDARAALAAATALPWKALDSLRVDLVPGTACTSLLAVGDDSLAALSLTRRPEIGRALAHYAVAEAGLRLSIARQYPDLELGPGFIWDQGVHRWTLAFALPNLLGLRNRAPMDQARAEREAAAAAVNEAQDDLLGETARAAGRCRGAVLEAAAAEAQVVAARRSAALARAAYERGETSRLDPALADLGALRAERFQRGRASRLAAAAAALEAAMGGPPGEAGTWPDPRSDVLVDGRAR